MVDAQKIFEILRTKNDETAVKELMVYFEKPENYPELRSAGYRPVQSNGGGFGYNSGSSESDLKEASLFSYAVNKNKFFCATLILQKLGIEILLKMSESKESGFHAVARSDHDKFREYFLSQQGFIETVQKSEKYREVINTLTSSEQHLLTLLPIDRLTVDEVGAWCRMGADLECKGMKAGNFLHYLCEKNKAHLLIEIARYSKELMFQRNDKGKMPIHIAAGSNTIDCFKILGDLGSPLAIEDKKLHRPLHTAVAKNAIDCIRYILNREPYVLINSSIIPYANVPTASMDTSLHILIHYAKNYTEIQFKEALDLLMGAGADPYLIDAKQQNAIHLAQTQLEGAKLNHFWTRVVLTRPMHLFSQNSLFAHIQATTSSPEAQALISKLQLIFTRVSASQDAIQSLQSEHLEELKQTAIHLYQSNPPMLQTFCMMLDVIAENHKEKQAQRSSTSALLSYSHQAPANSDMTQSPNLQGAYSKFY